MRQGWERHRAEIALDRAALAKLLAPVFPGAAVTRFERVSGGLVNTNFKVVPGARAAPLLLRIYQRDAAQGLKEAALIRRLGPCVPVPELFHAAENNPVTGHAYSILSWVEGRRLDALALAGEDLRSAGRALGTALASVHAAKYERFGFLGADLKIVRPIDFDRDGLLAYLDHAFAGSHGAARLGPELMASLRTRELPVVAGRARITSAGQLFGSADRLRALVKPLANAGTPTRFTVASRSYLDAQEMWAGCSGTIAECHLPPQGQLGRSTFKGKSSFANKPLSLKAINAMIRQIESRIITGSGSGVILLDSYGGAINRVKKDATAFVHRDALFSMQYLAYWDPSAAAEPNLRWLRGFYSAMRPYVSPFAYQNYIDPDLGNWERAYYGTNFDRLIAVKRRYDPQNVFRSSQSIPVKRR